jgi:hypothetical protein
LQQSSAYSVLLLLLQIAPAVPLHCCSLLLLCHLLQLAAGHLLLLHS